MDLLEELQRRLVDKAALDRVVLQQSRRSNAAHYPGQISGAVGSIQQHHIHFLAGGWAYEMAGIANQEPVAVS